jgi:hypothetical protein
MTKYPYHMGITDTNRRHRQIPHPDRTGSCRHPRRIQSPLLHAADLVETLYRGLPDNTVGKILESLPRVDLLILMSRASLRWMTVKASCCSGSLLGAYERRSLNRLALASSVWTVPARTDHRGQPTTCTTPPSSSPTSTPTA